MFCGRWVTPEGAESILLGEAGFGATEERLPAVVDGVALGDQGGPFAFVGGGEIEEARIFGAVIAQPFEGGYVIRGSEGAMQFKDVCCQAVLAGAQ